MFEFQCLSVIESLFDEKVLNSEDEKVFNAFKIYQEASKSKGKEPSNGSLLCLCERDWDQKPIGPKSKKYTVKAP